MRSQSLQVIYIRFCFCILLLNFFLYCKTSGNFIPRSIDRFDLNAILIQPLDEDNVAELKLDKSGNQFIELEISSNNSGLELLSLIQNGEIAYHSIVLQDATGKEVARQKLVGLKEISQSNSKLSQKVMIPESLKDGYFSSHLELLYLSATIQELCVNSDIDCPRIKTAILQDLQKTGVLGSDGCSSASQCQAQFKSNVDRINANKDTYPYNSVTSYGNILQYKEWNLNSKNSYFSIRSKAEVKAKKFDDSDFKEAPPRTEEKKLESTTPEKNIFRKKKGF